MRMRAGRAADRGEAQEKGLSFIESRQRDDGYITFHRWPRKEPDAPLIVDDSPFATACVSYSLSHVPGEVSKAMQDRAAKHLISLMSGPGVWRYWKEGPMPLPPDLDDTGLCSHLLRSCHPHIIFGTNIPLILSCRNEEGVFLTWVGVKHVHDVCVVVNSNVLLYLGDRKECEDAARYVRDVLTGKRKHESQYYTDPITHLHAASRALFHGVSSLETARGSMIEQVLRMRQGDGCFGDAFETALGCITLMNCGFDDKAILNAAADTLLEGQRPDGSWARREFFIDPGGGAYGAETLSTAFSLEALARIYQAL